MLVLGRAKVQEGRKFCFVVFMLSLLEIIRRKKATCHSSYAFHDAHSCSCTFVCAYNENQLENQRVSCELLARENLKWKLAFLVVNTLTFFCVSQLWLDLQKNVLEIFCEIQNLSN